MTSTLSTRHLETSAKYLQDIQWLQQDYVHKPLSWTETFISIALAQSVFVLCVLGTGVPVLEAITLAGFLGGALIIASL